MFIINTVSTFFGHHCSVRALVPTHYNAAPHIQQNQRSTLYAVTHGLCSPEDGHNDALNMLRLLIINI